LAGFGGFSGVFIIKNGGVCRVGVVGFVGLGCGVCRVGLAGFGGFSGVFIIKRVVDNINLY
jgi:hypothetical protein